MFHETSFDVFAASDPALAMPVVRERPSDLITPVAAAMRLFTPGEPCFLLESAEGGETVGRFSLLGIHATASIGRADESLDELRAFLDRHRVAEVPLPEALPAGAVGYMGYDAVRHWERVPDRHTDKPTPAFVFHHFQDLVVFDHLKQRLYLVTLTPAGVTRDQAALDAARARLDDLEQRLHQPARLRAASIPVAEDAPVDVQPSDDAFRAMVERAREYIFAGDVFQVVLSRTFRTPYDGDPLALYRAVRMINPSPFMFYLHLGDHVLVGASPEDLVRVNGDRVETLPIAGTRRRGRTDDEDRALARDLLDDPKERAEHIMLVDLARNDIGRISVPGTVRVERMMDVEKFSHVIHLVSRVAGQRAPGHDALEALCACFPAGTVSGAPKVRAMEIIDEMEHDARGFYAGSVVYFDGRGNLDSCIAIRTTLLRDGVATTRAGAGIVADSDPAAEERETRSKAAALLEALRWARTLT